MERGYYKRRSHRFEHTRAISYFSILPYMKNKIPIEKFWSLPTDEVEDIEQEEKRLIKILEQANMRAKHG